MKLPTLVALSVVAQFSFFQGKAFAQQEYCRDILKDDVFNETINSQIIEFHQHIRNKSCSTEWKTDVDIVNAASASGMTLDVFNYFAFGARSSSSHSSNAIHEAYARVCRDDLSNSSSSTNVYWSNRNRDAVTAAWLECMKSRSGPQLLVKTIQRQKSTNITFIFYRNSSIPTAFRRNDFAATALGQTGRNRIYCPRRKVWRNYNDPQTMSCSYRGAESFDVTVTTSWGDFNTVKISGPNDVFDQNAQKIEDLKIERDNWKRKAGDEAASNRNAIDASKYLRDTLDGIVIHQIMDTDYDGPFKTLTAHCPADKPRVVSGRCISGIHTPPHPSSDNFMRIESQGVVGDGYQCIFSRPGNFENNVLVTAVACSRP
jgi:hypothetical protein